LRTVALGMIARHSPEALNLVLVDFKGGATFLGLERAPHVAAVITNLSDEAPLVARMRDALTGEMNRRQELLRAAGNLDSVTAYERARRTDTRLAPLPTLFVIVDEFSELLSQHPDFADVFVAIGRLGRSLGMHLLLAMPGQVLRHGKQALMTSSSGLRRELPLLSQSVRMRNRTARGHPQINREVTDVRLLAQHNLAQLGERFVQRLHRVHVAGHDRDADVEPVAPVAG
jgi:hypothetical protein